MAVISAGHVGGTRCSGIVSSTANVLWMRWGEIDMCFARAAFVENVMRGWVWALPILWEQGIFERGFGLR